MTLTRTRTRTAHMKTDSAPQAAPFSGWKQTLIEDARRERSGSGSGSSGDGGGFVVEEKRGRVCLSLLFTLSSDKNGGFFKTGKIFQVRSNSTEIKSIRDLFRVTDWFF